jgi:hypothetical protein
VRPVPHQVSITTAAKGLLEDAKGAASSLPQDTTDWDFYYGVQTAAKEVLHSGLRLFRGEDDSWLRAESSAFREGYAKARTALATAGAASVPPLRIALPKP